MRQRIEIYDCKQDNVLAFDFREILDVLTSSTKHLEWYLLDLEAVGHGPQGESIVDFERRTRSIQHGIKFSWEMLLDLAAGISQTINATLVGLIPGHPLLSLPLRPWYEETATIVEAIDSSLWAVSSGDPEVIENLQRTFSTTTVERR